MNKEQRVFDGPRVEIHLKLDGPRVSLETWRVYSFVLGKLRRSNRSSQWIPDSVVAEGAKVQKPDFKKVVVELREGGYLRMRQTTRGCEYSLPINDEAVQND